MSVKDLNESEFDQSVVASGRPAVVDFWAEWCGPCRAVGPIVEELSNDFGDAVDFYKVNVDHNGGLATRFGIRGIPTLLFFKNGEIVESQVGLAAKESLSQKISNAFAVNPV